MFETKFRNKSFILKFSENKVFTFLFHKYVVLERRNLVCRPQIISKLSNKFIYKLIELRTYIYAQIMLLKNNREILRKITVMLKNDHVINMQNYTMHNLNGCLFCIKFC